MVGAIAVSRRAVSADTDARCCPVCVATGLGRGAASNGGTCAGFLSDERRGVAASGGGVASTIGSVSALLLLSALSSLSSSSEALSALSESVWNCVAAAKVTDLRVVRTAGGEQSGAAHAVRGGLLALPGVVSVAAAGAEAAAAAATGVVLLTVASAAGYRTGIVCVPEAEMPVDCRRVLVTALEPELCIWSPDMREPVEVGCEVPRLTRPAPEDPRLEVGTSAQLSNFSVKSTGSVPCCTISVRFASRCRTRQCSCAVAIRVRGA